jgi:DNA-binding IclR family transcriptional regulator
MKPDRKSLPVAERPQNTTGDRQFSGNLARGLDVLRAFSAAHPVLTNRDISERTGLPKATVSRLTYTLSLYGYLGQEPSGAYTLGTGLLSLVHPILASLDIRQIARPYLQELASRTGCTVNLAVRERMHAIHVDTIRNDVANPYLPDIGSVRPLLNSTIGRALILSVTGAERDRVLNRIKVSDPQSYEQGLALFREEERFFSEHGHCRARGRWTADVDAIAVPIPTHCGERPAAINCTATATPANQARLTNAVHDLKDAARHIGQALVNADT